MLQKQATDWNCVPLQQQRGGQWLPMPIKQLVGGQWRLVGCKFEQYVMWTQPDFYYPMDEVVGDQLVDLTGNLNLDLETAGSPSPAGYEVVSSGGPVEGGPFVEFHGNRLASLSQSEGSAFTAVASTLITQASEQSVLAFVRPDAFDSGAAGKRSVAVSLMRDKNPFLGCFWDDDALATPQSWTSRANPGFGDFHAIVYHDAPAANYLPAGAWYMLALVYRSSASTTNATSYRNGAIIGQQTFTTPFNNWENKNMRLAIGGVNFGDDSGSWGSLFDGGIAHVAYWNRSLSDEEVKMIAKAAGVYV